MNDTFEPRAPAAAIAGWRVVAIAFGVVMVNYLLYLAVMSARPAWLLSLWGPGIDWPFVQTVWFWALAILKVFLIMLALAALWLTLWARQLRKTER